MSDNKYQSTVYRAALIVVAVLSSAGLARVSDKEARYDLPPARYEVRIERDVMVPMHDGVKLATDIYFPQGLEGKLPVILIRTPYDKAKPRAIGEAPQVFPGQGYIVVIQDVRGKFASEGIYKVSTADTNDGYDTLSWIAAQTWSSGKIGTFGCSYLGENQIEVAKTRHPNLTAMIPQAAGGALGSAGGKFFYFGEFEGGVFSLSTGFGWFPRDGRWDKNNTEPFHPDTAVALKTLPVVEMVRRYGGPKTDFEGFVSHELVSPWWEQFGYINDTDRFSAPALQVNSWFDYGAAETLQLMNLMSTNSETEAGKTNQFIILGPTGHCEFQRATEHTFVGQLDVGDARFPYWQTYLKWYDYWLRGEENGVTKMPKIQYYLIGANEWRHSDQWPPVGSVYRSYQLSSRGHANTRFGDGGLETEPASGNAPDQFTYDPADPVPSRGGSLCCTGNPNDQAGSYDQSSIEERPDVLVYTTDFLKQSLDVIGPIKAVLYASSSARDTDFTAKLVDVTPDGRALNVQEGILRARFRRGMTKKVWMHPGEVYEVQVDLHATAYRFATGHRIRVEVSSSNFPRFARNLNTGRDDNAGAKWRKAVNTIHHSARLPSRIVLPIAGYASSTSG